MMTRPPSGILRRMPPRDGALPPFDPEAHGGSIPARFEEVAARHPGRIAIHDRGVAWSYAQLDALTDRIAGAIRSSLPARGPAQPPVALLFGHEAMGVAGMLGALKAGGFSFFMDPGDPPPRNRFLLQDSEARILLTGGDLVSPARDLAPETVSILDAGDLPPGRFEGTPPTVSRDAVSNLIYTSGSTGEPKGVVHTHANFLREASLAAAQFALAVEDRFGLLLSMGFGGTILQAYAALLNGSSLWFYSLKELGLTGLPAWMHEHEITYTTLSASSFRQFCHAVSNPDSLRRLRLIIAGGEPILASDLELYRRKLPPNVTLRLGGGTTEALWVAECFVNHESDLGDGRPPMGYVWPDKEVLLWDEDGEPVPPGEVGEIVIRGRYLSPGYWRRPELTREAFPSGPAGEGERLYRTGDLGRFRPGGLLVHEGRKDRMVKIRGHRVELNGIEAALLDHPGIREAAVVTRKDPAGETQVVAFAVREAGRDLPVSAMRDHLAGLLPDYMLPARILAMTTLPKTSSGKVDRRALPDPDSIPIERERPYEAPGTPTETTLAGIWAEVLRVESPGIHDDFFDLGGNSLSAMRILNQVCLSFGKTFPVTRLWDTPTIHGLAGAIDSAKSSDGR